MKEINQSDRRVANIYDAPYKPFMSDGVEDGHVLQLNTSKPLGVGFFMVLSDKLDGFAADPYFW